MESQEVYDLIGDIHGHADELTQLLETLGYRQQAGVYGHPQRRVIFLGDFIDRGPKIREVLQIVRPMVLEGRALAVMGNHELNALAYHRDDPQRPGEFLRPHNQKNLRQHEATLQQLRPPELELYLDWFRRLPLWLDLARLRVVHACWDEHCVAQIAPTRLHDELISDDWLYAACKHGGSLFAPVEILLKGKEVRLPQGFSYQDKDGHIRTETRVRWYLSPQGHKYRTYAWSADEIPCDYDLDPTLIKHAASYPTDAKPVFVGHYWLQGVRPEVLADNVVCLDYSVAKGGFLCAYRWQGEQKLTSDHFVWLGGG